MTAGDTIQELSLFGGPLQRLGCRLGLVRGKNTFWVGVVLGLLAWGVLVVLALLQGVGDKLFSLSVIGVHVRLLVAIPLFFLCESWVGPRMAEFMCDLVRFGVVPESGRAALGDVIRRVDRLKDSWLAEIVFLLVVVGVVFFERVGVIPGVTGNSGMLLTGNREGKGMLLGWYLWFCLPLFRFLLIRWYWHLMLWWYLLWQVQRLDLHLVPTHPDHAAGLGYLEVVQEHFAVLVVALSAVMAASIAEGLSLGVMAFESLYRQIPVFLVLIAVMFIGPLFIFSGKLWNCRVNGWRHYMGMGSRYVNGFNKKWILGENPTSEPLLGTPDLQSLADLTNSVTVVRDMQWVPASRRLFLILAAAAILPMLPLVFFKYPVSDVASKLFQAMTGL